MCRPTASAPAASPELADIIRARLDEYRRNHSLNGVQMKALEALQNCRTAALGGHLQRCDTCGAEVPLYNSCRNRHCPKCQGIQGARWVEARLDEVLPVPYFHIVFTLPHSLNPLAQGNPALIYNLLFRAASATLLQFARDPQWLGAEPGITMVLHTWGQNLNQHIHVHCVVSGGGLTPDGEWKTVQRGFFAPVRAMSKVFRGKFLDGLKQAYAKGELRFAAGTAPLANPDGFRRFIDTLYGQSWVIYAKRPFAGPQQVLKYLSRYTHRTAIGNSRIVSFDGRRVRFRYKDYRDNRTKIMTLDADEFLRRFLLHILPQGFMRIRHYGLLANRTKAAKLEQCRLLLHLPEPETQEAESGDDLLLRLTGIDPHRCPVCGKGRLYPAGPLPSATGPPEETEP
jgi:predicted RNA-binding Zn-ribbon protein involved in translation (DUF1610 family)